MKKTSILIPTFNKSRYLDLTLQGYILQEYKDFEIIIVDDGSTDNTKDIVNEYRDKLDIKYIYQENKGRASARNTGLQVVAGDYIIFNDDDRIPCRNFLKEHMKQLVKNDRVITFGEKHELLTHYSKELLKKKEELIHFLSNNPERLEDIIVAKEFELFSKNEMMDNFEKVLNTWDLGTSFDTYTDILEEEGNELEDFRLAFMVATTANLGYNRKTFPDIRFDENYIGWGMEDTDFVYQLDVKGCKYWYIPEAKNYHQKHGRAPDALNQLFKNISYFCKKNADIRAHLFSIIFKGIMGMTEANKVIHEIEKNPDSDLAKSYIKLCRYISMK